MISRGALSRVAAHFTLNTKKGIKEQEDRYLHIECGQNRNFVMAVADTVAGSQVIIRSKNRLAARYAFWDINFETGRISLSSTGDTLSLGANRIAPESLVNLKPTAESIRWSFTENPGNIDVASDPPLCLAYKNGMVVEGNPVWLYRVNNAGNSSPWKIVSVNQLESFE
ncbi:hypothetical protein [Trinickia soli]|uniref:hypothetical protein n=1 Tax=Trinickia soli TaxID=380675 RepID=UPI003FA3A65E